MSLRADFHWMCEAISNILKNCVEHAQAHSTVHASYADNPLYTELRISDEGPGFSSDDLAHLFDRFYQGRGSVAGATGLGLSFAASLSRRKTEPSLRRTSPPAERCSKSESIVTPLSLCIRKLDPSKSFVAKWRLRYADRRMHRCREDVRKRSSLSMPCAVSACPWMRGNSSPSWAHRDRASPPYCT